MRVGLLAVVLAGTLGCATALRPPPSLEELSGARGDSTPADVDALLDRARLAFDTRTPQGVRTAAAIWLTAAAADPSRVEGLIGAVRAGVWLAEHEADAPAREAASVSAVQSAQLCRQTAPERPECAYWLAVAVGVQARERRSTALDAVRRMVELLEQVIGQDPTLEHGGPHRVLALVLARAPGWPMGPGDPDRGLEQARLAVAIDPDHPPNQLCLGELLAATEDAAGSRQAYLRAAELARRAAGQGHPDAEEWRNEAEKRLGAPEARSLPGAPGNGKNNLIR